jgi:hypothetical protein
MKPIDQLQRWLHNHPLKAVFFTVIFTILATSAAFREDIFWKLACIYAIILCIWGLIFVFDNKRIIALALTAGLLFPSLANPQEKPPQQEEEAVAVTVGVIVICGGSYCIYKMIKICQKNMPPKDTNSAPSELTADGSDEYGGAQEFSSIGSCYIPASPNSFPYEDLFHNPTTFTIDVSLNGGVISTRMGVNNQEGTAQTWDQFVAEMADHGLFLTGRAALAPQYERDGVPCDAADVPLSFDPLTGHVIHNTGGELRTVSVERSPNMETWYPFLATDVADGSRFRVVDTTREGQMFYRVQLIQP